MSIQETDRKRALIGKLTAARTGLLVKMPFYGTLLMRLKYGLANCKTACTDMKRILWDPEFLERLSLDEVQFVMLHEVMHCVLDHINRSKGKIAKLYNVAADIVVNSIIMKNYGVEEFIVDDSLVMHLSPDGKEGCEYSADQVYTMLYEKYRHLLDDVDNLYEILAGDYEGGFDNHEIWEVVPVSREISNEWKNMVKEAAKLAGLNNALPSFIRELLECDDFHSTVKWKELLHEFIQIAVDSFDFTFTPADRRFSDSDYIMPSFCEVEGERLEKLWVLIDTSGSVDDRTLTAVFGEIKAITEQFTSLQAKFSCFDTSVTEPVVFSDKEDLKDVKLIGGGGTSFHCIFEYLKKYMMEDPPAAIIIMTDGYAFYPKKEVALEIPVLWILIDNERDAPWGKSVHIQVEPNEG